jgi:hypothetical protein
MCANTMGNHGQLLTLLHPAEMSSDESFCRLLSTCKHASKVYEEMLTQVPHDVREAMQSLRDLQSAELQLVVAAMHAKQNA